MFSSLIHCLCFIITVDVKLMRVCYPHSTRLCGSYYRQVLLKDRRTFPLWFRYSKLHECLGFSWAWNSCTHLHMQLWRCSLQVNTLAVCYWIWPMEGHVLFGKMLHLIVLKNIAQCEQALCTTGLVWDAIVMHASLQHDIHVKTSDLCFNSVCLLRVCVFTVIFKVVICFF